MTGQPPPAPTTGCVYLLHFTPRLGHAGHYLGWATNLDARMWRHLDGGGSRLVLRALEAGCVVELVRWWPGDRTVESQFKRHGGRSPRSRNGRHGALHSLAVYCPRCNPRAACRRPELAGWIEGEDAHAH